MDYARLLDYHHNFIEAIQYFYELFNRTAVNETEHMIVLKRALVCTPLASVGDDRTRMLTTLFKDGRCQQLPG